MFKFNDISSHSIDENMTTVDYLLNYPHIHVQYKHTFFDYFFFLSLSRARVCVCAEKIKQTIEGEEKKNASQPFHSTHGTLKLVLFMTITTFFRRR